MWANVDKLVAGSLYCDTLKLMNDRFKTDFLCSSSSFLGGFGSVLNLQGHLFEYNCSRDPDRIALAQDWRMVGQDISDAMEKAKADIFHSAKR
jgi:hypothetical protein